MLVLDAATHPHCPLGEDVIDSASSGHHHKCTMKPLHLLAEAVVNSLPEKMEAKRGNGKKLLENGRNIYVFSRAIFVRFGRHSHDAGLGGFFVLPPGTLKL